MAQKQRKLCFIGSMSCAKTIENTAKEYEQEGYCVQYVRPRPKEPIVSLIEDAFDMIDWAEIVIPIPKKDGSFGEGTLYEMAYAKRKGKIILYER